MNRRAIISAAEGGVAVRLKAVPGAKRNEIAGVLGDRLKVRVSAPPEGGKANKAICVLLAKTLGLKLRDVEIVSGQTNPEKVARLTGLDEATARQKLL
ncbi:MAG: DUF167 domain-containing protein [Planctomycetota bacterium]|nr:DUF167 domain-containing protein [Planctomycetota bacterium]